MMAAEVQVDMCVMIGVAVVGVALFFAAKFALFSEGISRRKE
jgi:hypothetical protein